MRQQQTDTQTLRNLQLTLSIYEKCLSFDFNQVHMNESLDDAPSTNIPGVWRQYTVENP